MLLKVTAVYFRCMLELGALTVLQGQKKSRLINMYHVTSFRGSVYHRRQVTMLMHFISGIDKKKKEQTNAPSYNSLKLRRPSVTLIGNQS